MLLCCSHGVREEREAGPVEFELSIIQPHEEEQLAIDGLLSNEVPQPSGWGQAEAQNGASQELDKDSSTKTQQPRFEDPNLPGAEYRITISKADSQRQVGLDLDVKDGITAVVTVVWPGPVQSWNLAHGDLEVRPNDRILSVNGASGDVQLLLDRLREDAELEMLLRRPTEFRASATSRRSLGVTVGYAPCGTSLLVDQVSERGLLTEWNDANPGQEVRPRDRIVEVNRVRGPPELLLRELNSAGALELVLFR
mmetsp:Transcript_14560/g.30520  ORF Transcript_14560/g.30520 Transcript_14560/m.30520 type:complete len:253 (+) Transcript_14560:83-841(+)